MGEVHHVTYEKKGKGGRPPGSKNKKGTIAEANQEAISKITDVCFKALTLPPIDESKIEEVMQRTGEYFAECQKQGAKVGTAGLCAWLGIHRQTWYTWCNGTSRRETHYDFCVRVMGVLDAALEGYMQNSKVNPLTGIYYSKNHFGYKDKSEVVIEPKNTVTTETNMSDVMSLIEEPQPYPRLPDVSALDLLNKNNEK